MNSTPKVVFTNPEIETACIVLLGTLERSCRTHLSNVIDDAIPEHPTGLLTENFSKAAKTKKPCYFPYPSDMLTPRISSNYHRMDNILDTIYISLSLSQQYGDLAYAPEQQRVEGTSSRARVLNASQQQRVGSQSKRNAWALRIRLLWGPYVTLGPKKRFTQRAMGSCK